MSDAAPTRPRRPASLLLAVALTSLEAVAMLVLTVVELASVDSSRIQVAVTTGAFFLIVSGALAFCARGLWRLHSWARSPIVVAQLIAVLTAWSFRDVAASTVTLPLAAVSLLALIAVLHPATNRVLDDGV
ncbi:hypothetical protein [Nocardioides sp.]|uniref:hypothetical protein n=1 Tax=Nocardioides sp. TaxID=35761 RepID=UPI0035621D07